ncbi:MAG TPA: carbohydrate porin, partial [Pyrinomonadaceae bacterium]
MFQDGRRRQPKALVIPGGTKTSGSHRADGAVLRVAAKNPTLPVIGLEAQRRDRLKLAAGHAPLSQLGGIKNHLRERYKTRVWFCGIAFGGCLLAAVHASAQEDKKTDDDKPADPDTGESTVEEKTLGLLRQPFRAQGVKFAITYIGEVLGNTSGGLRQGTLYEGRLNLAVDVDLQKLAGWDQLTFHANIFQIHGQGLSRDYLQNYFVVSGVEALPATRLYEAYVEKKWGNQVSLKAGQLAADSEFFNAKYTDVMTNASLGWPAITSLDLLSGGPSPPLSAVGARLLVNIGESWSILGGIFDGNQAGPGTNDPQQRDPYGLNFR